MKVKDLIELLKQQDQDADVMLECDHGQQPMSANCVVESYVTNEYMAEHIDSDDLDGYTEDEYKKAVVIEAY